MSDIMAMSGISDIFFINSYRAGETMPFYGKSTEKGYRDFLKDLKNDDISPFVLLYGKEQFLVDWAVKAMKDRYVNAAVEVMDYESHGEETDADTLLSSLAILPVMSERRMVYIRDFAPLSSAGSRAAGTEDIDRLCELIKSRPAGIVAVFSSEDVDGRGKLVKALKKYGSSYLFDSLSQEELEAFAAKRFHAAGLKINRREMNFLIRETGYGNRESDYTLFNFDNDIKKIAACCDGLSVTQEAIADTVIGDNDTFIFDLLDGISGNDKKRAFEILNNRLSKDQYEAMSVTGAICSQLEIMLEAKEMNVRDGAGSQEIARRTGMNEYRVRKALGYANRYSLDKLKSMLENIYDVNKNIVNGLMEPSLALEMFIASI